MNSSAKTIDNPFKLVVYEDGHEILEEFRPLIRVYRDGRIERLAGTDLVPAGIDTSTGVQSKDVVVTKETNVSARLYKPANVAPGKKLPLLIYFHGGGFVIESAFSPIYHRHLNLLASQANIIIVSINYRLAPEHPLPIAYFDSWHAIQWVTLHSSSTGEEPWLNEHVDFGRVFLGGDSAGGNITHNMAMRNGLEALGNMKIEGILLNHPEFWGSDAIVDGKVIDPHNKKFVEQLWLFSYPEVSGPDDPKLNPNMMTKLSCLGCKRVLILVAEHDFLNEWQWHYYQVLLKSGWKGDTEILESKGEGHVFYLFNPTLDNSKIVVQKMVSFINKS